MESLKLAISNVAWYPKEIDKFIELISSLGCQGIELAASMLWEEPVDVPIKERLALRQKIEDRGLRLTGLQALLYTRQDLFLFKDGKTRKKLLDYLTELMDLCSDLEGEILVFGSPRNRNIGDLPPEKAQAIGVDFFRKVGKQAEEHNLFFCIEPLGRTETDFINTVAQAERLIEDAGRPKGLGLHIDIKGLIDENEVSSPYLTQSFARAKHVHLNDPGLMPPGSTGYDHRLIREKMRGSGYSRFVSIEMRRQDADVEGSVRRAVDYVKRIYFT